MTWGAVFFLHLLHYFLSNILLGFSFVNVLTLENYLGMKKTSWHQKQHQLFIN